jgi:hypothetical protein
MQYSLRRIETVDVKVADLTLARSGGLVHLVYTSPTAKESISEIDSPRIAQNVFKVVAHFGISFEFIENL